MTHYTTETLYIDPVIAYHEQVAEAEYLNSLRIVYGPSYACADCYTDEGMLAWDWYQVERLDATPEKYGGRPDRFFTYTGNDGTLFTICTVCNPTGIVPPGFSRISYTEARIWVAAYKEANADEVKFAYSLKEALW